MSNQKTSITPDEAIALLRPVRKAETEAARNLIDQVATALARPIDVCTLQSALWRTVRAAAKLAEAIEQAGGEVLPHLLTPSGCEWRLTDKPE